MARDAVQFGGFVQVFYRNVLSAGRCVPDTSTLINTIVLHKKIQASMILFHIKLVKMKRNCFIQGPGRTAK
jgi:hypothetical protein